MRTAGRRSLQGLVLAMGAPLGWLLLRALSGRSLIGELREHELLYLYLLVPTAVVFASFGAVLGLSEEALASANRRLADDALTDELTGLKNLRYFRARLEEECAISRRDDSPVGLLIADLDRFKLVNDRYGHPVGDRLLKAVGVAIASAVRKGETAARVGGEEFGVLLPGASGSIAVATAERLRVAVAAVQLHPSRSGSVITITLSVGCVSTADLGSLTPEELYVKADEALYAAKRRGRDRAVLSGRDDIGPIATTTSDRPGKGARV